MTTAHWNNNRPQMNNWCVEVREAPTWMRKKQLYKQSLWKGKEKWHMHNLYQAHNQCYSTCTCTCTSMCSGTQQRPFELWLILWAWPHTPQAETSSQAGHVFAKQWHNKVRLQHRELRALLFSNSAWVLLCLAGLWTMKNWKTGPMVLSSLSEKTRKSNNSQM